MTDLIKRGDALAAIEDVMVRRIKFHQDMKRLASTGQGQRREHNRMHALSEALGEIRRAIKEDITSVECLVDPRLADSIKEYVK